MERAGHAGATAHRTYPHARDADGPHTDGAAAHGGHTPVTGRSGRHPTITIQELQAGRAFWSA